MIEDCVIIGGGVAGLSAANRLADAGLSPLLIEAGHYPSHKICGEFFSHECLPILDRWNIPLSETVARCRFIHGPHAFEFDLPKHSGSTSRFDFDSNLFKRAKANGARALTKTKVDAIHVPKNSSENYVLTLSDGQAIKAHHLMIGTGRVPKTANHPANALPLKYAGFKAHFEGIPMDSAVEMHVINGGYLGISKIDDKTVNIACIVKKEECNPIETFMDRLKAHAAFNERMKNARIIFPNWLVGEIPEFGIRSNPSWENVFWIGDAAGSIPPVSGEGLAIAVTSGCMAAEYLLNSTAHAFRKAWLKRFQKRFFWAQRLHKFMLTQWTSSLAVQASSLFPGLPLFFWKLTRETAIAGD